VPGSSQDEKYVILTLQPRIAAGSLAFAELPAGMLDGGTFSGTAAREIEEEVGLKIPESELLDMTAMAVHKSESTGGERLQDATYPSPGACDEYIPIFLHQKRLPRGEIREIQGRLTGLRDHGERITLKLVRLEDLWKEAVRDGKTLAALALYTGLRADGDV
jgi:ADP-sugar diphosphatase